MVSDYGMNKLCRKIYGETVPNISDVTKMKMSRLTNTTVKRNNNLFLLNNTFICETSITCDHIHNK